MTTHCILMIVSMWSGPPDFKCVAPEVCRWIDVKIMLGLGLEVTRKGAGGIYTTDAKHVYCFPEHKGKKVKVRWRK